MGYSKTNERLAVQLREDVNEIRENDENWKLNEDVIETMEELESVGYFYDEDSWNVYPNEDEYFDESPLDLYVSDDDDDDDDNQSDYGRNYSTDEDDY